jgi:hypothetical protein
VPPCTWASRVSPSPLPLVLYGVNALLPLLICAGRGMWGAVLFGALAMAIPLLLALRGPAGARVERRSPRRAASSVAGH